MAYKESSRAVAGESGTRKVINVHTIIISKELGVFTSLIDNLFTSDLLPCEWCAQL